MGVEDILSICGYDSRLIKPDPHRHKVPRDTFPIFHPDPLSLIDIPWHPRHSPLNTPHYPDPALFFAYVLDQGCKWITTQVPWGRKDRTKVAPRYLTRAAKARVEVCKHKALYRPYKETSERYGPCEEYWFGRRSVHVDVAEKGSASFAELKGLLKEEHAANEALYHSGMVRAERVTTYDLEGVRVGGGWEDVTACVNVITHTYPMCARRCYTVLEVTGTLPTASVEDPKHQTSNIPPKSPQLKDTTTLQGTNNTSISPNSNLTTSSEPGFIVIQIPLHYPDIPSPAPVDTTHCILANYVSIEMVRYLSTNSTTTTITDPANLDHDESHNQIEWTMATSGDAGGWIPDFIQRSWTFGGVPKQIVKDVGVVLGYLAKRRETQRNKGWRKRKKRRCSR